MSPLSILTSLSDTGSKSFLSPTFNLDIIDLFINPEDLINYLDEVIFRQLFNWNDFIEYFIENNSSLNLENNSSIRYIVKRVNIMGQNVNHNFDGVILYMYNDGSIERKYYIK